MSDQGTEQWETRDVRWGTEVYKGDKKYYGHMDDMPRLAAYLNALEAELRDTRQRLADAESVAEYAVHSQNCRGIYGFEEAIWIKPCTCGLAKKYDQMTTLSRDTSSEEGAK